MRVSGGSDSTTADESAVMATVCEEERRVEADVIRDDGVDNFALEEEAFRDYYAEIVCDDQERVNALRVANRGSWKPRLAEGGPVYETFGLAVGCLDNEPPNLLTMKDDPRNKPTLEEVSVIEEVANETSLTDRDGSPVVETTSPSECSDEAASAVEEGPMESVPGYNGKDKEAAETTADVALTATSTPVALEQNRPPGWHRSNVDFHGGNDATAAALKQRHLQQRH
ncbi:hypothetical protein PHYPSEUDO_014437 [Phytophthora pseudosyringae]|uniref:Uncharacterized protein n=1 Tax=Phytophthora pseudosyringae TaxID=221518 RepID=A0A8T1V758_9STRA|nr:hypothetical protein PHYPSEUDO_014437 [Phytophthora pseudosyringae]